MSAQLQEWNDTIVAIATAPGIGAIAVIRLSGSNSITIANQLFTSKNLDEQSTHTLHVGLLKAGNEIIDEVVMALYRSPKSYTGEDIVEISCHGSPFIQQQIIDACIQKGARLAKPGEFTQRAFLNGKMDLAQAEAVADIIASQSQASKQTALKQLRGGFSNDLSQLRNRLIEFASLIELELDFSQEDVAFADRNQFMLLIDELSSATGKLADSFRLGNVIKNGVSVAIIGKPNAGKSTLLNALVNEERAIVSDIAGTTRDAIEETLNINGIIFRIIDTAGIREHSSDAIENLGMERSRDNAEKANLIIHLVDLTDTEVQDFEWLKQFNSKTIKVFNKLDAGNAVPVNEHDIFISAKSGKGIEQLKDALYKKAIGEEINTENTIITNARHHSALLKIKEALHDIKTGLQHNISGDLLAPDIRRCLNYLGIITGEIETDRDILGTIFGKFCIGK
ncbi:MAG: tRNA uridine-5-carboxymethylaminomethyl(34) synthesis GTPase MnmE [Chitinophagaceae bacterium]|nr:tRNA uridine-5-carboxymethylaminomethyl(34) synthesis GTPase MnmE [Chitinophagaceae bacterium]